jgi:hypothetical protein
VRPVQPDEFDEPSPAPDTDSAPEDRPAH